MPYCSNCNKGQSRLKNDSDLCSSCFNEYNSDQVKRKDTTDSRNGLSTQNDLAGATYVPLSDDNMSPHIAGSDSNKTMMSDLSIDEWFSKMQDIIKPIEYKIDVISTTLANKVNSLGKKF